VVSEEQLNKQRNQTTVTGPSKFGLSTFSYIFIGLLVLGKKCYNMHSKATVILNFKHGLHVSLLALD